MIFNILKKIVVPCAWNVCIEIFKFKAAPWDDINFRFYFRTEVVYLTDHVFIFFRIFIFYKYF